MRFEQSQGWPRRGEALRPNHAATLVRAGHIVCYASGDKVRDIFLLLNKDSLQLGEIMPG